MKLRIPRRIKVEEEESSESESETPTDPETSSAQDPVKDKVPVVTTKAITVSVSNHLKLSWKCEIASASLLKVKIVFKVELDGREEHNKERNWKVNGWGANNRTFITEIALSLSANVSLMCISGIEYLCWIQNNIFPCYSKSSTSRSRFPLDSCWNFCQLMLDSFDPFNKSFRNFLKNLHCKIEHSKSILRRPLILFMCSDAVEWLVSHHVAAFCSFSASPLCLCFSRQFSSTCKLECFLEVLFRHIAGSQIAGFLFLKTFLPTANIYTHAAQRRVQPCCCCCFLHIASLRDVFFIILKIHRGISLIEIRSLANLLECSSSFAGELREDKKGRITMRAASRTTRWNNHNNCKSGTF